MNIKHALALMEAAGSRPQDNEAGDTAPMGVQGQDAASEASGLGASTARPADQAVVGDIADPSGLAASGEGIPDEDEVKTDMPVPMTGVLQSFKEDFTKALVEGTKFKIDMKEELGSLFESQELSEEFSSQAIEIFESAVNGLARMHTTKISEYAGRVFESIMDEKIEIMEQEVDAYLNRTVAEWTQENRIAIEHGIRTEISESFMVKLKELLESHYVELPEAKRDLYETAISKGEEILESYNSEVEVNQAMQEEIKSLKKEMALRELTEGMVETQAIRVRALAEDITFVSEESFSKKLKVIKESVATKPVTESKKVESTLVEDVTGDIVDAPIVEAVTSNPEIAALANAMKRYSQK